MRKFWPKRKHLERMGSRELAENSEKVCLDPRRSRVSCAECRVWGRMQKLWQRIEGSDLFHIREKLEKQELRGGRTAGNPTWVPVPTVSIDCPKLRRRRTNPHQEKFGYPTPKTRGRRGALSSTLNDRPGGAGQTRVHQPANDRQKSQSAKEALLALEQSAVSARL